MSIRLAAITLDKFTTFGDLLRFLRRRAGLTQQEFAIAVGYSNAQISRLELNQRPPDLPTVAARFIPALEIDDLPEAGLRLLELATGARRDDAPASGLPPFKGLHYFDEVDADLFFGREALVDHLLDRLQAVLSVPGLARFLAVVGASGSGKSSIVRAGLIPALRWSPPVGEWLIVSFTPSTHPLQALAAAVHTEDVPRGGAANLASKCARSPEALAAYPGRPDDAPRSDQTPARPCLLVVDQFEEVFTLCRDEDERRAFIDNLVTAALAPKGLFCVVITLRADFYAHCAPYARLRDVLSKQQEYIGPMSADELRRAIEEPAKSAGWELEPGLVDVLLRDVGADGPHPAEPGALPLLSHALLETWHRRRRRTLTVSGYLASGGVRGAIAETAEAVFHDQLDAKQRLIARNIFLRLTEFGDDTMAVETRRRTTFEELISGSEDPASIRHVLNRLADARLITTEAGSAEVAHEALIREWPTLRRWLEEDRDALRLHRHLTLASEGWAQQGRDPGELYRGARLAQALEWAAVHSNDLNSLEREFLGTAQALSEQEAAEREARHQQELAAARQLAQVQSRSAQQLRRRAVVLTGALVLVFLMAGASLWLGERARQAALSAQAVGRVAVSRELAAAAVSNLDIDPERSILLALEAASVTHTLEAEDALHRAIQASRVQLTLSGHGDWVNRVAYSPDGTRLATTSDDGTAKVWSMATGQELFTVTGHEAWVMGVAFSPDGTRLATTGAQGQVIVSDAGSGQRLLELSGRSGPVWGVAFSPDSSRLATSGANTMEAYIWDAVTGQQLITLTGHTDAIWNIAFSPDGKRLATGSFDGTARLWDATTGVTLLTLTGHAGWVRGVAFSPDGRYLATASDDNLVRIWDTASGVLRLTLAGHSSQVLDIAFSPDGTLLASASGDRKAIVWRLTYDAAGDIASGQEWVVLSGHAGIVSGLAFHPDGLHLATASADATARVWDISPEGGRELLALSGPSAQANSIAFSPDGTRFATTGNDGVARIWDATTGQELLALAGQDGPVGFAAFSPDGTRLATATIDVTPMVWDAASGQLLFKLKGHVDTVNGIAFSPDGTRIATVSNDGTALVWDALTGDRLLRVVDQGDPLLAVAFSPDGSRLATAGRAGIPKVWAAPTGKLALALTGQTTFTDQTWRIWGLAFSPLGDRLATTSQDGAVRVWDLATGQALLNLIGHEGETITVAYSPDGQRLVTSSRDGTARLWDATTGQSLLILDADLGGLTGAAFDPTGTRLATSGDSGVRLYALSIDDLMALARQRVTRALTPMECQTYLHVAECP